MRIVFAALYDPWDLQRGSGTSHFLCRELTRQGHEILAYTPPEIQRPILTRLLVRWSRARGLKYRVHQDPWVGRKRGLALAERLRNDQRGDILLTNDASIAAHTPTSMPIVLYTDAIFPPRYRENVHPWLDHLSLFSVAFSQRTNRLALRRARRVLVASHWAADLAKAYGGLNSEPEVIPYGANLETWPDPSTATRVDPDNTQLDLLFVGKDWTLKGGHLAVEVVTFLRRRGYGATLQVVGAKIPTEVDKTWIVDHGMLDKAVSEDRARLEQLYRDCTALLLPSRAEGFGIVYAEAAAFGLPVLALRTTGVETSVADGESGVLFPVDASASALAQTVESWCREPERYHHLCRGAGRHFIETVNWSTATRRLTTVLENLL